MGPSIRARQQHLHNKCPNHWGRARLWQPVWSSRSHYHQPGAANNDTLYIWNIFDKNTMLNTVDRCDGGIKMGHWQCYCFINVRPRLWAIISLDKIDIKASRAEDRWLTLHLWQNRGPSFVAGAGLRSDLWAVSTWPGPGMTSGNSSGHWHFASFSDEIFKVKLKRFLFFYTRSLRNSLSICLFCPSDELAARHFFVFSHKFSEIRSLTPPG